MVSSAAVDSGARRCFVFVLMCGATIAPVGDHFHVARGVTEYLTSFGPIWLGNSPLWFVAIVAPSMAALAVAQGGRRAPRGRPGAGVLLSPLVVLALYLTTSFYPLREGGSLEAIMTVCAVAMGLALDSNPRRIRRRHRRRHHRDRRRGGARGPRSVPLPTSVGPAVRCRALAPAAVLLGIDRGRGRGPPLDRALMGGKGHRACRWWRPPAGRAERGAATGRSRAR